MMHRWSLYLMVVALPFNGLRPIANIGELSGDGFFYASLLYLAAAAASGGLPRFSNIAALLRTQSTYICLIAVSLPLCAATIFTNGYGHRSGIERYIVSTTVYLYYFFLASTILAQSRAIGILIFMRLLSRAFTVVAALLLAIGAWELLSWFIDPLRYALVGFRSLFSEHPLLAEGRLSGVSLEPSFNAFAILACIPFVIYQAHRPSRWRGLYISLATALLGLSILSGARTAYVGLVATMFSYIVWRGHLRKWLPNGIDGAIIVLGAFFVGIAVPYLIFFNIDPDQSTSNITRGYLTMAAITSGLVDVTGQGFGQVGFYVVNMAGSAVEYSWELMEFYQGGRYGELPPLFSWYARTFGEFGPLGYVLIAVSFSLPVARLFRRDQQLVGDRRHVFLIAALTIAQFFALALSIESLRVPQFWFAWILIVLTLSDQFWTGGDVTSRRRAYGAEAP